MNKEIAAFILRWRYDLKCRGIPKRKWRKIIANHFICGGEIKKYEKGADQFCKTWDILKDMGQLYC